MIVIAAFLSVFGDREVPRSRSGLLEELLRHEQHHWQPSWSSRGLTPDGELQRRTVALATLAPASSESDGASLLSLVPDLLDASTERRYSLARWYQDMYPSDTHWWGSVEPDLLGEFIVTEHLADQQTTIIGILDENRDGGVLSDCLNNLTRLSLAHESVANTAVKAFSVRLVPLLVKAITSPNPNQLLIPLGRLSSLLEIQDIRTLVEAEKLLSQVTSPAANILAAALTACLARCMRRLAEVEPEAHEPSLAIVLNNLGTRLASVGRLTEAKLACEESVGLLMTASSRDVRQKANLAVATGNLGVRQSDCGESDLAISTLRLAVQRYHECLASGLMSSPFALANCLHNLSAVLGESARRDEGLAAIDEAMAIYTELERTDAAFDRAHLRASQENRKALLSSTRPSIISNITLGAVEFKEASG